MEAIDYTRFILAFVFVVALIGLCGFLLKKYVGPERFLNIKGPSGRLKIVEIRYIDSKTKLVLVRRDTVEHLMVLHQDKPMLLESGIRMDRDDRLYE